MAVTYTGAKGEAALRALAELQTKMREVEQSTAPNSPTAAAAVTPRRGAPPTVQAWGYMSHETEMQRGWGGTGGVPCPKGLALARH